MKVVDVSTIEKEHLSDYLDVNSNWYTLLTVYHVLITILSFFGNAGVLFLSHRSVTPLYH